ncbi:ParB/RepB/Spo0J family partition protein [Nocardioides lentus]|uniref:ParB/RepB/Spo0J family partition protein n=1 Tax=Nocardioides lentus TaxID=338077 RepID=UPI0031D7B556
MPSAALPSDPEPPRQSPPAVEPDPEPHLDAEDLGTKGLPGFDEVTRLIDVLVDELHPDPDNPREDVGDVAELAASMEVAGLLQPIVARRVVAAGQPPRLVVVAGHRRLAAAKHLGWTRVACIVRRDMPADEVLAAMLIENGQRAGLDPIEEARALRRLAHDQRAGSHQQIARLVGRTQVHVSGRLALLELSAEDQAAVRAGELSVVAAVRRGRVNAGRVRPAGSTGTPHLGAEHDLARRVKARCVQLKHKRGGRNSVGGVGCGECWESVIRADERTHLHDVSNDRGRCVLCDTDQPAASPEGAPS